MFSIAPDLRKTAHNIFRHALAECSIELGFARKVRIERGDDGHVVLRVGVEAIELEGMRRIGIVAAGKAATAMLECLLSILHGHLDCDLVGVLIAGEEPAFLPPGFQFFRGGHPFPNEGSIQGARAALTLVRTLGKADPATTLCLFLISGGASAIMELPLDPTISLEDVIGFHRELVHSGASIAEINCVRKHFSAVKGGRLAMAANWVPCFSLLVSDVPPGHLDALASGPTLPDSSTVAQCREILDRRNLLRTFPSSVQRFFLSQELPETPKPGKLDSRALTLLASEDMASAAKQRAEAMGLHTVIDNTCDDWDYRAAAVYLIDRLRSLRRHHPRVCLISSGEVTVELAAGRTESVADDVGRGPGIGGRNQHLALYAATLLGPADASTLLFSAGSDGIDGNSTAAGAVVDETTISTGESLARAEDALQRFDSGTFLKAAGADVVTGATGNNLRDLRLLLAARP